MINQNNKQIDITFSEFEKNNIQISKSLIENFNTADEILETLNKLHQVTQPSTIEKQVHYQQLMRYDKIMHEINTLIPNQKQFSNNIKEIIINITDIIRLISKLVKKLPYISKLRTSITGDYVREEETSHFYKLNHQELLDFLKRLKNLTTLSNIIEDQCPPICLKLKEIINLVPTLKLDYFPHVLYADVPESFERIILLNDELKKLLNPYMCLIEFENLIELFENITINFQDIVFFLNDNPEKDVVKLKGKFKPVYVNLVALNNIIEMD
ncbi:MAG: hypothetical protein ACFE9S_04235 [Candidatus Hermodarchaeota archaeon]